MTRGIGLMALAGMVACGGDSGGGPDASVPVDAPGVDADPGAPDAMGPNNGVCEEGGRSTSNSYLPMEVGYNWRYLVDEFDGNPPAVKAQLFSETLTPDEETG